ncbi:MAG: hypothetical protein V4598_01215 [Bdellovibrionota bacterium]
MMKKMTLLLLAVVLFSCNKNSEKSEPLLACPLLYEMEKIEVNFELTSVLPAKPEIAIDQQMVVSCREGSATFCLYNIKTADKKITFQILGHKKLDENVLIELLDGGVIRTSRQNEAITRARTRPNDKCGSGFYSSITIKE